MKFNSSSDSKALMKDCKTVHQPRDQDLNDILMEWIRQCCSKKVPLNHSAIKEQSKVFHERLALKTVIILLVGSLNLKNVMDEEY